MALAGIRSSRKASAGTTHSHRVQIIFECRPELLSSAPSIFVVDTRITLCEQAETPDLANILCALWILAALSYAFTRVIYQINRANLHSVPYCGRKQALPFTCRNYNWPIVAFYRFAHCWKSNLCRTCEIESRKLSGKARLSKTAMAKLSLKTIHSHQPTLSLCQPLLPDYHLARRHRNMNMARFFSLWRLC